MITQLFRSKSCVLKQSSPFDSFPPSPSFYLSNDDEEEMEEEKSNSKPISTPLIVGSEKEASFREINTRNVKQSHHHHQLPMLEVLVEALRKSLVVSCTSVGMDEINNSSSMDIGWPTDVCHLSHVTFDRFNGFLGLPVEFQPEIPTKVPSASASVFGVSASSMQCSFDERGNSVPTILLMMQKRLYSDGGLQAEGIFRITGEDNQEEYVRCQLNKGIVPCDIDVHCLAGLIKAWFRELPKGILDSLSPEQIMNCNTKEECVRVASLLQPTEFSLLDWAVNLMADVVQHEPQNKMNARNIAMVFAPNMTQMADPLTALMHAVRVMNFLKTLIVKVLREREKSSISSNNKGDPDELLRTETDNDDGSSLDPAIGVSVHRRPVLSCFLTSSSHDSLVRENEIFWSGTEHCKREEESEKISWRNGVRKLYKYTLFQNIKRSGFGIPNNRAGGGGEAAWV